MIEKKIRKIIPKHTSLAAPEIIKDAKAELGGQIFKEMIPGIEYRVRLDSKSRIDPFDMEETYTAEAKAKPNVYGQWADRLFIDDMVKLSSKQTYLPWPKDVIFNAPATVVFWDDGTKTVVKLMEGEEFNPEVGLAMCFCKKVMGDGYKRWFKDALKKGRWQ